LSEELVKGAAVDITPDQRPEEIFERLRESRRMSAAVSLACGAVGLVPLPLLPDLAIAGLRSALLSRMARHRGIELEYEQAQGVTGDEGLSVKRLAASLVGLRAGFTRALLLFVRFEEVGRTFLMATYFDYYLLRHHQGRQVTSAQATLLRLAIEQATSRAHVDIFSALFQKAVRDSLRVGLVIPRSLYRQVTELLNRGDQEMEQDEAFSARKFLGRVVRFVEAEMDQTGREGLEAVLDGFDHAWRSVAGRPGDPVV